MLARKSFEKFSPYLLHVTGSAHVPHGCTVRVRACFKNIHEVLAILKAATIATKFRPKILVLAYHRPGIYGYEMCNLAWS